MIQAGLFMENFYILDDGRVRQFLIVGEKEAILIDTGFPDSHVYETVQGITNLPVRVIMTHADIDHAGGLKDFGSCRLHEADWNLVTDDVRLEPLRERDVFECGGYRLKRSRFRAIHTEAPHFLTGRKSCCSRGILCRRLGQSTCSGCIGIWICI